MPHCIFEYSANIADEPNWPLIMTKLHEKLISTGQFQAEDIKSRVIRHENFLIGNGESDQSFITLNMQMLDGRSDEVKQDLRRLGLEILVAYFPQSLSQQKASITVQISDIHRASYQRQVSYK